MKLTQALQIAARVKSTLAPHCERIEIAGSCRRRKPDVGDIEIVCIPKTVKTGLFGDEVGYSIQFSVAVHLLGKVEKGNPEVGRYVKIWLPEQIQLDLFITTPECWGLIYAIRTGSARFSHEVLASGWVKRGFRADKGVLYPLNRDPGHDGELDTDHPLYIREEIDLFNFLGLTWIEPEKREI